MAFGIPPKYSQEINLDGMSTEQFIIVALEAVEKLDWSIGSIYELGFVAFTKFSWSSWSEAFKLSIEGQTAVLKSECTGSQMMDWGKNKKNINRFISAFEEIKNNYSTEELAQKYDDLKYTLAANNQEILSDSPDAAKENPGSILSLFKPTDGYFITPILININLAIFIFMLISGVHILLPDNESLLKWGANFRPITLEGQPWRLLSNCFLHIGIIHLLMNMYALLYIGLLLEPYLGKIRFLTAYLLTGIVASVASLWWHELTISAGASGAIFGMYGVFLAMLTTNLIEKSARKALLMSIGIFVFYNIVNGLKPNSGIDNAAHIGGLISGLLLGYALIPSLKQPEQIKLKYTSLVIVSLVFLLGSLVVYQKMPNDIGKYDNRMKDFISMESMALEVYNLPDDAPKDKVLYEIKERGIFYWNENLKLLEELKAMDLPAQIETKNNILKEYCELRIQSYELLYKAVSEDTDQYKEKLEALNQQIEAKINEIGAL